MSFAVAALMAMAPVSVLAAEDADSETVAAESENSMEETETEPEAQDETTDETTEIETENVSEGLEDFELPNEDQLNNNVSEGEPDPTDDFTDLATDPTETPDGDDGLVDEDPTPDGDTYTPPPVQDAAPSTGQETPFLVMAGIASLAAGGVAVTLKKRAQ